MEDCLAKASTCDFSFILFFFLFLFFFYSFQKKQQLFPVPRCLLSQNMILNKRKGTEIAPLNNRAILGGE